VRGVALQGHALEDKHHSPSRELHAFHTAPGNTIGSSHRGRPLLPVLAISPWRARLANKLVLEASTANGKVLGRALWRETRRWLIESRLRNKRGWRILYRARRFG
jgi:hypothetical protein